ncbi:response regulator transcription factor [Leptothoe spongobia]|uniref:Response regulator n=1 Tax=Leptothoe spongobia TAU-MAC 1115 TaxID=1967444 RepID=A0A947DDY8_9CYAN|nr:response regulator [Leptothoe spongobia]MBT9314808.1 response regulator [Leptothoe spongobia TAU-MAC 1115]
MVKIVLINNGESSYQTLEQGLKLYEYEVITTDRGDDGLLLALSESPNLILVDMEAPVLDGWQIIKNLKQSRATWLIPVIALASRDIEGQLLIQAGFDAYDRKPLSLKHLLRRIEALLGSPASIQTGTDYTHAIPVPINTTSSPEKIANLEESLASTSVVYVDDSPADSEVMAEIVKKAGYSYFNISDSLQALPQLLELKPQLIFLDLVMPMANGYELCAQIRRISAFKKTPIVIVTNNNGIADRLRSRFVGAYGFLHKPIREKYVLKILKKYDCQPQRYKVSV